MQLTINPALEAMNPGSGSFNWLFHNSENRSKTKPKFIQYIGTEAWQEVANLQKAKKIKNGRIHGIATQGPSLQVKLNVFEKKYLMVKHLWVLHTTGRMYV